MQQEIQSEAPMPKSSLFSSAFRVVEERKSEERGTPSEKSAPGG